MLTPDRQHNLYTKLIFNLSNHIYIIFTHYKKSSVQKSEETMSSYSAVLISFSDFWGKLYLQMKQNMAGLKYC